jgi:hypothetical protein
MPPRRVFLVDTITDVYRRLAIRFGIIRPPESVTGASAGKNTSINLFRDILSLNAAD